ncbi:hypothetical protein BASA50_009172 [Batrachochytrium salamandrivorans]|uniref:Uncharacterized protein n=1 Tax=Batrachochytrium salamandrivorans TaxID=1357716 RepID=A0ABQ8F5C0_9FUNG|nr:hypothetical protein BASA60_011472 [Batrachochytrium salamandrivorans]KAH6565546.1 hypothetical protein BASA62_007204 [Batrachochytrium salamandrivorans]KAH6590768.1 hypothetical protein BASA50_009172 [Batrachochytrium salamandrivorans]KAH6602186.1 hypothetical protein BASA61_001370 [Batrachochytrium salamandrivorans]KAH9266172.1 hypothetical protein BASA84_001216 [Batrachochytrium salamandrivorans]
MKVAAATILSLVIVSAYASPAAYSANQEVNTDGSTIASSASAHLEKRGGGLHGDYAQGATGANDSPPNDLNHASPPARGHEQHPQRPSSPELYGSNQPQHPTPPRELGPYGIPQHSQQHYQENQDASNPHELSQNAQSAEGGANTKDEDNKTENDIVSFGAKDAKFKSDIIRFNHDVTKFEMRPIELKYEKANSEAKDAKSKANATRSEARGTKFKAEVAIAYAEVAKFKAEVAKFEAEATRFDVEVFNLKDEVAKLEAKRKPTPEMPPNG